jgi:dihydroxyacid dehydratase/phosphogluconate dehydratase
VILRGNLAPEGCVVKVAGREQLSIGARADLRREDAMNAVTDATSRLVMSWSFVTRVRVAVRECAKCWA